MTATLGHRNTTFFEPRTVREDGLLDTGCSIDSVSRPTVHKRNATSVNRSHDRPTRIRRLEDRYERGNQQQQQCFLFLSWLLNPSRKQRTGFVAFHEPLSQDRRQSHAASTSLSSFRTLTTYSTMTASTRVHDHEHNRVACSRRCSLDSARTTITSCSFDDGTDDSDNGDDNSNHGNAVPCSDTSAPDIAKTTIAPRMIRCASQSDFQKQYGIASQTSFLRTCVDDSTPRQRNHKLSPFPDATSSVSSHRFSVAESTMTQTATTKPYPMIDFILNDARDGDGDGDWGYFVDCSPESRF